jgi:hypothetical protein
MVAVVVGVVVGVRAEQPEPRAGDVTWGGHLDRGRGADQQQPADGAGHGEPPEEAAGWVRNRVAGGGHEQRPFVRRCAEGRPVAAGPATGSVTRWDPHCQWETRDW